jgi:hypothetical protein
MLLNSVMHCCSSLLVMIQIPASLRDCEHQPPAQEDGYFYTLGEKKRKKDEYVHVGPSTSQDGRNKRTRA